MGKHLILKKNVQIDAPISVVWEALTNSEKLKNSMFGCEVVTSWKVGSDILFKGIWDGNEFVDKGIILDFQLGKSYKYSYWSNFSGLPDEPENYSVIKLDLESDVTSDRTILSLEQTNFATETMFEHSDQNWGIALNALKELIETDRIT